VVQKNILVTKRGVLIASIRFPVLNAPLRNSTRKNWMKTYICTNLIGELMQQQSRFFLKKMGSPEKGF